METRVKSKLVYSHFIDAFFQECFLQGNSLLVSGNLRVKSTRLSLERDVLPLYFYTDLFLDNYVHTVCLPDPFVSSDS